MKIKYFYSLLVIVLLSLLVGIAINGCTRQISQTCPTQPPDEPATGYGTIMGKVSTDTRNGTEGVLVSAGSLTAMTNNKGEFTLSRVPAGLRVLVNFSGNNYTTTQKIVVVKPNKTSYVEATVMTVALNASISSASGGTVNFQGAKVVFPSNAFVFSNGNAFNGNAQVKANYFNPTNNAFIGCFPGEFKGIRTDNSETMIESFGFINVDISAGGVKLQLAPGKTAAISLPIPSQIAAKAPQTIPLWYYDETKGRWFEEGTATKQNGSYVGTVSHFTSWNCDQPTQTSFLEGRVIDGNGNPLSMAYVRTRGVDYTGSSICYTDNSGNFRIAVKSNSTATIRANWYIFQSDSQQVATPATGTTQSIGDIVINVDTANACYIVGRYIDAGGLPIPMMTVRLADSTNKLLDYTFTNSDGVFKFYGYPSTKYILSIWVKADSGKTADTITTPSTPGTYDIGTIQIWAGGTIVKGRVVDSTGTPISNVVILCKNQDMFNGQREMQTDASGIFQLWLKPNVTFDITFYWSSGTTTKTITNTSPNLGETKDLGDITLP